MNRAKDLLQNAIVIIAFDGLTKKTNVRAEYVPDTVSPDELRSMLSL